jgi:hypothetical protein
MCKDFKRAGNEAFYGLNDGHIGHNCVNSVTFDHNFGPKLHCNIFCVDNFDEHLWKDTMKRFVHHVWGSGSAPFKVLLALALLVMTSMQFTAYAQNSMDVFQSISTSEIYGVGHSHMNGEHVTDTDTALSDTDLSVGKHSAKHPAADTDCEVHCSPLAAFAPSYFQPLLQPKRSFEPVLHRVLTSSAYDRQARPPKHLI